MIAFQVSKQVIRYGILCLVLLVLHMVLQQLYYAHCRASLLNIFLYGSSHYCRLLDGLLAGIESHINFAARVDVWVQSFFRGPGRAWRTSILDQVLGGGS